MFKIIQLIAPSNKQVKVQTNHKFFAKQKRLFDKQTMQKLSRSKFLVQKTNGAKQNGKQLMKTQKTNQKQFKDKKQKGQDKSDDLKLNKSQNPKNHDKENLNLNYSLKKQRKLQFLLQLQKAKTIFQQKSKMKKEKNNLLNQVQATLNKDTQLKTIYENLFNLYESVPFTQKQREELIKSQMIQNQFQTLHKLEKQVPQKNITKYCWSDKLSQDNSFQDNDKCSNDQQNIKKDQNLQHQQNIRKQIKSLTRDTNHILSIEFKQFKKA